MVVIYLPCNPEPSKTAQTGWPSFLQKERPMSPSPDRDTTPNRMALEDLWRERLRIALERYRNAKVEGRIAIRQQEEAAPPDGSFAYRKTLRVENAALVEYRRVLRIFTDLTVNRKMPPAE